MKDTNKQIQNPKHYPVLLEAVLQYLNPQKEEKYLDLTAGYGGHASEILDRTLGMPHNTTLVDRDRNAIATLSTLFATRAHIIHKDFYSASRELLEKGQQFDLILADLGVSSPHLDEADRGFSFRYDGQLDMRMDDQQGLTANEIVNSYEEAELVRILKTYGEEPRAKKIARCIVENRPITTTKSLAGIVAQAWPGHSRVHPATRTFQALRIAVNDELEQLKLSLPLWIDLLAPGGRIAVISFHSLEDRIVKRFFAEAAGDRYDAVLQILTKSPVTADDQEIVLNPRSRSAKLRCAVKK